MGEEFFAALAELADGCGQEAVGLGGDQVVEHLAGVVVEHLVDVVGQHALDRAAQEFEHSGSQAAEEVLAQAAHDLVDGQGGHAVAQGGVGQFGVDQAHHVVFDLRGGAGVLFGREVVEEELLEGLLGVAHAVDEVVDGGGYLLLHVVGEELGGEALLVEEVLADGGADGAGYVAFFFGYDAGGEGDFVGADVFGLVGSEEHGDGQAVGDAADDCPHGGA